MKLHANAGTGLNWFDLHERIVCGFSRRDDGGMSIYRGDPIECVQRRKQYFAHANVDLMSTVWAELVHGISIHTCTQSDAGRGALNAASAIHATDGLWTTASNLTLCTTHADCLPLYFAASDGNAVGVAHCGWRSIVAGLPAKMIEHAIREFGLSAENIHVGIGPGIRVECFQIGEDILDQFPNEVVSQSETGWYVDLPEAVYLQLLTAGIRAKHIDDSGICSKCTPLFSSYRREQTSVAPAVASISIQ